MMMKLLSIVDLKMFVGKNGQKRSFWAFYNINDKLLLVLMYNYTSIKRESIHVHNSVYT